MGSDCNGGLRRRLEAERPNVFALVVYVPDPLGRFLDDLRRELVPHYNPHAHVSVLPPRTLSVSWETASNQARALTESWAAFDVELTGIEVFPVTDVIYIDIGEGGRELHGLHKAMSAAAFDFEEPFPYHPHITLAQDVPHDCVAELHERARRRWAEFRGPRTFRAERAAFVQNTHDNCWVDLAEYTLGSVLAPHAR
jgi:2'-5' RNA ligase